jgi:hypothetical protein
MAKRQKSAQEGVLKGVLGIFTVFGDGDDSAE